MTDKPDATAALDSALRFLGTAEPPVGLEARVVARVSAAQAGSRRNAFDLVTTLGRYRLQLACAAVLLVVVAGMLYRYVSLRPAATPIGLNPVTMDQGSGMRTAGARQFPVAASRAPGHGRSQQRAATGRPGPGRATVARDAHRAAGVVAPADPRPVH